MANRGSEFKIAFDFDDDLAASTCVSCGECVQACPTGALMPASVTSIDGVGDSLNYDRKVASVCQYCGVGVKLIILSRMNASSYVEGRNGPANQNRLCVKGRFGADYIHHGDRINPAIDSLDRSSQGSRYWF